MGCERMVRLGRPYLAGVMLHASLVAAPTITLAETAVPTGEDTVQSRCSSSLLCFTEHVTNGDVRCAWRSRGRRSGGGQHRGVGAQEEERWDGERREQQKRGRDGKGGNLSAFGEASATGQQPAPLLERADQERQNSSGRFHCQRSG